MGEPFSGLISLEDIVQRIRSHPLGDRAEEQRERFAQLVLGDQPATGGVREGDRRQQPRPDGCGSPLTHFRIGRGLAERTGWSVVLPDYPLAPEHRWPAQLGAALAATMDIAGPVVLAGDSAGGHLALVTALELALMGSSVAGLVLFSPNTDRSGLSTTRERNDPLDPMVDDAGDRQLAKQCFGELSVHDRQVSPVLDDLAILPPMYLEVGSDEVLLGDSLALAERAREAGRAVTLHVEPDGLHMGQLWDPWWPTAAASLDRAAAFVRAISDQDPQSR